MASVKNMFRHINGLPNIPEDNYFELSYDNDKIYLNYIKIKFLKSEIIKSFEIKLNKIVDIDFITEEYMKDKSVIKRAIVGAFISPLGAIIGGISGIGQKKAKKKFYSITYLSSDDKIKNIIFNANPVGMGGNSIAEKFNKEINSVLNKIEKDPKIEEILNEGFEFTEDENGVMRTEL